MSLFRPDDATLTEYVYRSLKIEGIPADVRDHIHFGQHLEIARRIRDGRCWYSCREIQAAIMKNNAGFYDVPGVYRDDVVYFGSKGMPLPQHVKKLMEDWEYEVNLCLGEWESSVFNDMDTGARLNKLHDHALCIHPFPDGNGRTFRLMLNQCRQIKGLKWIMYEGDMSIRMKRLRHYEETEFRPKYAWSY